MTKMLQTRLRLQPRNQPPLLEALIAFSVGCVIARPCLVPGMLVAVLTWGQALLPVFCSWTMLRNWWGEGWGWGEEWEKEISVPSQFSYLTCFANVNLFKHNWSIREQVKQKTNCVFGYGWFYAGEITGPWIKLREIEWSHVRILTTETHTHVTFSQNQRESTLFTLRPWIGIA